MKADVQSAGTAGLQSVSKTKRSRPRPLTLRVAGYVLRVRHIGRRHKVFSLLARFEHHPGNTEHKKRPDISGLFLSRFINGKWRLKEK